MLFHQQGACVDRQGGGFRSEVSDLTKERALGLARAIIKGIRNDRHGYPPWSCHV